MQSLKLTLKNRYTVAFRDFKSKATVYLFFIVEIINIIALLNIVYYLGFL